MQNSSKGAFEITAAK